MGNVANVSKVANVANACGLVGRLQHDMQKLDCALSMSQPTEPEQCKCVCETIADVLRSRVTVWL